MGSRAGWGCSIPSLVITRGIPGCGKTTFARAWVDEDLEKRVRVNRDDLRQVLYGLDAPLPHWAEKAVSVAQRSAVSALLKSGKSVIVDDTHISLKYVKEWEVLAAALNVDFEVNESFREVEAAECVRRDLRRCAAGERHVGADVIIDMQERLRNSPRWTPAPAGIIDLFVYKYVPDLSKPPCWMFDIDGTLATMNGRGPFEWHRVHEDSPNPAVVRLAQALHCTENPDSADIVVMSGRDEVCREATENWLRKQGIFFTELHMRAQGDHRKDAIVKLELFREHVAPHWNVLGVIDDRKQVVDMWREIGLTCFQCAEGDF